MTEMRVIAPSKYQVASNGTLAEHSDLGDGRRMTHWKNPVPTAPWLYFVGVAQMAVEVVDVWNGVPVETWVYWQDRDAGFYDFAEPSAKVLAYYSDLIGPYVNDRPGKYRFRTGRRVVAWKPPLRLLTPISQYPAIGSAVGSM